MPRNHKKTGLAPGGQAGNANALKHGAYSLREKAEHLRAHAALRSVKALGVAERIETERRQARAARKVEAQEKARDAALDAAGGRLRDMFERLKNEDNLRGVVVDMVHNRVAATWLDLFPGDDQPDWVWAWSNIQPNASQSPAFQDGDDIAPGVPGEGYTPCENTGTTPPRRHTKTRIGDFIRGWWCYANATAVTGEMVKRFLKDHPTFGSADQARGFLTWGVRTGLFARP